MASPAETSSENEWMPLNERELLHLRAERARQDQRQRNRTMASQEPDNSRFGRMNPIARYYDIPVIDDGDYYFLGHPDNDPPFYASPKPAYFEEYERSCRKDQLLSLQRITSLNTCTLAMLHHGLILALTFGSVECAQELLIRGAPIAERAPESLLSAPRTKQIPLLDTLAAHGWTPSHDLFMQSIPNLQLVQWFLSHKIDPNYGFKRDRPGKAGGPSYECADALERAASEGSASVIDILIAAGAKIGFGHPLHTAAMVCPPDRHPYSTATQPEDSDTSRIPAMAALVAHGADVNEKEDTPHLTVEYPLLYALQSGAVRRARWLLEHGADAKVTPTGRPKLTAAAIAEGMGNQEMMELFHSHSRSE